MSRKKQDQIKSVQETSFTPIKGGILQRKCACGQLAEGGECADCRAKREGTLQRAAVTPTAATGVPPVVHDVLRSPGQSLDPDTRSFMEPRFSHDFSEVRVHTDTQAAESARSVNALAYTVGQDVVFGQGHYDPQTSEGKQLLAHELTHVVQQSSHLPPAADDLVVSSPADASEQTAHRVAGMVSIGQSASIAQTTQTSTSGPLVQRQDDSSNLSLPLPTATQPKSPSLSGNPNAESLTLDGFDLGGAELTDLHRVQLDGLASDILSALPTHPNAYISIVGFTDTVGTDEQNAVVGQKRADAVLAYLAAKNVPENIMKTANLASSVLRVDTGANVPEPRNRRVEITFEPGVGFESPAPQPTPAPSDAPLATPPSIGLPPSLQLPPRYKYGQLPEEQPDYFKPIPPPIPTPGTSVNQIISDWVDKNLKPFLRDDLHLPDWAVQKVLDAAHDGVEQGITGAFNAAVDSTTLGDRQKAGLKQAFDAALQLKSQ
jgi:outer membrane protein OmpA-like peptidoglycan-associated protein